MIFIFIVTIILLLVIVGLTNTFLSLKVLIHYLRPRLSLSLGLTEADYL